MDILSHEVLKALNFICQLVLYTDGYNSRLTMASCDEPARKKRVTESTIDFRLCLLCQGDKLTDIKGVHQLEHLRQPKVESYQPLLDCIYNRAQYQDPEYVRLNQQLSGISGKELDILNVGWHKSCHGKATHKQHIERDKARYDKAILSQESSILSYRKVAHPRPKHLTPQTKQLQRLPAL